MNRLTDDEIYARYDEAIAFTRKKKTISTAALKQGLNIGHGLAALFIENMERDGVITAPTSIGKRLVLKKKPTYTAEQLLASG